jgi:hypothetical protein
MRAIGPTIDITIGDPGALALPLQLTLSYDPGQVVDATHLVVLHYDATRGYEVATPVMLDSTLHTVTVESAAFSPYTMVEANPPPAADTSASSMTDPNAGAGRAGTADGGTPDGRTFDPLHDEWNVGNFANSPLSPGGVCLGMSTYAVWYYVTKVKPSFSLGYAQPRLTQNQSWGYACWYFQSSPVGPNLPSQLTALQAHLNIAQYWVWEQVDKHIADAVDAGVASNAELNKWFANAIRTEITSGRPVVLIVGPPSGGGDYHAVVAYDYDAAGFDIYDPNCQRCLCHGSGGGAYICNDSGSAPRLGVDQITGMTQPYVRSCDDRLTFEHTWPIMLNDYNDLAGFDQLYVGATNLFASPALTITSPPQFSSVKVSSRGETYPFFGSFHKPLEGGGTQDLSGLVEVYYGYLGEVPAIGKEVSGGSFSVDVPLAPALGLGVCPPVMTDGILVVAGEPIGDNRFEDPSGRGPHSGVVSHQICTTLTVDSNSYTYQPETASCVVNGTPQTVCVPDPMPTPNDPNHEICCTP